MLKWLKQAFAIDPDRDAVPTSAQAAIIDRLCQEIVRREMSLPALMMLESSIPLHFLSGQFLRFSEPILSIMCDSKAVGELASFLEQRGAVQYICARLDDFQQKLQAGLRVDKTPTSKVKDQVGP